MKVLSLFDGMSVAQQALKELGIKVEAYFASEIDKYAIAVTQSNFPDTVQLGSVVGLSVDFQPDLMILGSPCQDLSIAKKDRRGLDGERSGLFWEAIRIHTECKPKFFVYENVASMGSRWKGQMLKAIQEIDPSTYAIEINASLVSAQNRRRIFFTNIPGVNQPQDRGILLEDILEKNVDASYYLDIPTMGLVETKNYYQYDLSGKNYKSQDQRAYKKHCKHGALAASATKSKTGVMDNVGVRRLTVIECLRLQSMPDDYFDKANYKGSPVSNSQRYKMCGNAFSCAVVKHIISHVS